MKFLLSLFVSTSLLSADLINQIYEKAEEDFSKGRRITQSQSHLLLSGVKDMVLKKAKNLNENADIIKRAFDKETEHADYYVFYTSVPYMRLFQDLVRNFYVQDFGAIGALKYHQFQFLRYFYNDPFYDQYKDINEFLFTEIGQNGMIDDNMLRLKIILLSTNLSFFGNIGLKGESTYSYLNEPQKWVSPNPAFLKDSLLSFGYPADYVDDFMALIPLTIPEPPKGELFQIFIPKKLVDKVGYLSWRQGIPFDPQIMRSIFPDKFDKEIKLDYSSHILGEDLTNVVKTIRENRAQFAPLTEAVINKVKQGYYKLSDFLNFYKNPRPEVNHVKDNWKISLLNYCQARLLITNKELLNPTSGILIYRYSLLEREKLEEYTNKFNELVGNLNLQKIYADSPKDYLPTRFDIQTVNFLIKQTEMLKINNPIYQATQSQALLQFPGVENKLKAWSHGLHKNAQNILTIFERERQLGKDHYVFYTAIPYMRIAQDVIRLLYKRVIGKTGGLADKKKAFQFLRFDITSPTYHNDFFASDFIVDQLNKYGIVDDRIVENKTLLVSSNLAVFGNAGFKGESSWFFYNFPQVWAAFHQAYLVNILQDFGFDEGDVQKILPVLDFLKDTNGHLESDMIQIFIPKSIVDNIGYISWIAGIPFDEDYLKEIFTLTGMYPAVAKEVFGPMLDLPEGSMKKVRAKVKEFWNAGNKNLKDAVMQLTANVYAQKFYPSQLIEQYIKDPASLKYANNYQARLLITKDILLNPESGIQIFRYSALTPEAENNYKASLRNAIDDIVKSHEDNFETKVKQCVLQKKLHVKQA